MSSQKQKSISQAFKDVNSFSEGGRMHGKITNSLLYMIAVDNLPLVTTEHRGFKFFMKTALPLYKIPSRATLTRLVDEKYEVLSEKIKQELVSIENFTLTSDVWTDPLNTKGYLGITIHYLHSDSLNLKSFTAGVYNLETRHTHDYIGSILTDICEDWNIAKDKIVVIVTDNGANIVKAIQEYFGIRKHLPCFAHTINLVVTNSVKNVPQLKDIILRVKAIVTFFKQSINASDELRKLQLQNGKLEGTVLKLIQECETRWNSLFYMLQRFVKLASFISTILFHFQKPSMISREELEIVKEVTNILGPFEKITVEMSGESYVTCSRIIPIVHCLKLTLEKFQPNIVSDIGKSLLTNLINDINKRFYSEGSNIEQNRILSVATVLDPRFKSIHFDSPIALVNTFSLIGTLIQKDQKTIQATHTIFNDSGKNSNDNLRDQCSADIWEIHNNLILRLTETPASTTGGMPTELKQYLDQAVLPRSDDPLKFWNTVKTVYPNLSKIAFKFLPVVGTSVPSERLFSKAGNILTEKRNRLIGKRLSKLIFLSSLSEEEWYSQ